jgi:hypothetical protein
VNLFRFVKGGDGWGQFTPFHKQIQKIKNLISFPKGGKNEQETQLANL